MASAVDTVYISTSYDVPESTIQTLLDTDAVTELVKSLLVQLENKARDYDELKSEKLRSDVELENAVRTGDARARMLRSSVEKSMKEVEILKKKLDEEGNIRAALETELQELKSSTSHSTSETGLLKTRISTLEESNRDALALVDSKSAANDKLQEDLHSQQQRIVSLRRDVTKLEEKLQSVENAASATKFREQSLQQEIELLKKNNEWHESELKAKSAEYTKFRKEKTSKIAELQRLNEDATETIESLRRTESTLRSRIDEVNARTEDALSRIQQLQEDSSNAEKSFRVELDSAHRLADLQSQRADAAIARLQDVQHELERNKEDAAAEVGQLQAEVETEKNQRENLEGRLAQLELEIERGEISIPAPQAQGSLPGTPRRNLNGIDNFGQSRGSPAPFSPGSSRTKGGLNVTQLYAEYTQARSELASERRRNEKLTESIEEMIRDLEEKQPEMEELRIEHGKFQEEARELSQLLEEAREERDKFKKEARKSEGQLVGLNRENDILRQQLRDLSAQVKMLLVELQAQEQGLGTPTDEEQALLEELARGEQGMSDTGRFISQRLTIFKSVAELQERNLNLLRVTRELGEQMEGEEAKAKRNQEARDQQELHELRELAERHREELKHLSTQSESYIRERDAYRRMLTTRGTLPPASDAGSLLADSTDRRPMTPNGGPLPSGEQSPKSKELADYGKLLKDMQSHFDAYRQETTSDHLALKQQASKLAKEKSELQGTLSKINSQLTLSQERYELLQMNFSSLKTENAELQRRSQTYAENAAKHDLRTQQIAEELVEAKSLLDSMRNEIANLKAEKELWKKIEARLTEDNRLLLEEKSKLNKMIADLQNLQNERELSESENRRRLQQRVESLESDLQSVQRKLEKEQEEGKNLTLRREYEQEQSRTRIDDLLTNLSNTKEELVAARTQRDSLQTRVDELKIEVRNAEERAQVLQPRPTPRRQATEQDAEQTANEDTDGLSKEQKLGLEVADLKRDLELAKAELEASKSDIEQYKAISHSSEEELASLNETYDNYRDEMDRILGEKEANIRDLDRRVQDISSELASTNAELSRLRTEHEESASKLNEQRESFDLEVQRLKDDAERYLETANLHREDLKAQAEIAQRAQQNYENELIQHAEASKALQKVRTDYNQLRTEVAQIKSEAEATKTTLTQNEDSWAETRNQYERELAELKTRREETNAQNRVLHDQLEKVSAQIAALKQSRKSMGPEGGDTDGGAVPGSDAENLQEVIRYLRREKEIVDVQYELGLQESKRLKQQVDHLQNQLDQAREKLNLERQSQVDKDRSLASHKKLMETINELNLYRESSTTLRNDARQAQAQVAEKSREVERLTSELEPLRARLREVESDLETKEGEIKLLKEDNERWQQRNRNILQKYDRVDPAELQALKTQISDLQIERDQLVAEKQSLQAEVDGFPERIQTVQEEVNQDWQERRNKLIEQFKQRSRDLSAKIRDGDSEQQRLRAEAEESNKKLASVEAELEATKTARDEALSNAKPADSEMANGIEEGQVEESSTRPLSDEEKATFELRIQEQSARVSELEQQIESLHATIQALEAEKNKLEEAVKTASSRADEAQASANHAEQQPVSTDVVESLRAELATKERELEALRSVTAITNPQTSEEVVSMRNQLEGEYAQRVKAAEETYNKRAESMKKQLSTKLQEGKEKWRKEVAEEYTEAIEKLKAEHEAAVEELKSAHQAELEKATQQLPTTTPTTGGPSQPETAAETAANAGATVKVENTKPISELNFSDEDIRNIISTNAEVKRIVTRNIQTKLEQAKAELTQKLEEQEKATQEKLEEFKKKADKEKEQAVMMESKRTIVKLNMTDNRLKTATARLEVVQTAAKETPERAVGEVWSIAQNTKPAPVTATPTTSTPTTAQASASQPALQASQGTQAAQGPSQAPQAMQASEVLPGTQTTRPQEAPSPDQLQPQPDTFGRPPSFSQPNSSQQGLPVQPGTFGRQIQAQQSQNQLQGPPQQQSQAGQPPQPNQLQISGAQNYGIPNRPPMGQSSIGTGPGALRGIMNVNNQQGQSGIPRGGGIPRPIGRGGPQGQFQQGQFQQGQQQQQGVNVQAQHQRGGHQGVPRGNKGRGGGRGDGYNMQQNNQSQGQNMGSPGGGRGGNQGNLNPTAKQWLPGGNKRPHEGSEGGNGGKRPRGGPHGN